MMWSKAPDMRVLLATSVNLDLMLERDSWRAEAEAIAEASVDGRLQAHACGSSITDEAALPSVHGPCFECATG